MDEKPSVPPVDERHPSTASETPLQKFMLVGGFGALVVACIALKARKIPDALFLACVIAYVLWLTFVTFWKRPGTTSKTNGASGGQ
ncbi:MAG: hypothetical protein JNM56_31955 [Planctomycetia bacterium]|nr:hypothetical protein [Planctomycetia bacterium]